MHFFSNSDSRFLDNTVALQATKAFLRTAIWAFLFLGANIDAIETAGRFGISADRAVNYNSDHEGTALNYEVLAETICEMRFAAAPIGAEWKKRIDEDYEKRGRKGQKA